MYLKPQTSKIILFCIFIFTISNVFSQEIGVGHTTTNTTSISDNSTNSPDAANNTLFGAATSRTFYIDNIQGTGSSTLTITSITLSNTTDFTISSNLPDNTITKTQAAQPFTIALNASACGTVTSTVTINHDGSNDSDGAWTFTISATKTPEMDILRVATPIAVSAIDSPSNFLNVGTGSSVSATYTIQNNGNCDLDLSAFSLTNTTDFTITATDPSTITAGGSTTFTIDFNPTSGGTLTTILSITNNDSDENPYTFTIQGTSTAPLTEGPGGVVADLKLWLKSNEGITINGTNGVTNWATQALGSDATVNTTGQEPTYRDDAVYNVNFNPVVDFDNTYEPVPLDADYSYDDTTTQFLEGTSGFYTEDIFIVVIPDVTVNNSFGSMDLFCGDEDFSTDQNDATGIGFGKYSIRFTDEVISYAVGTTNEDGTGGTENGYGVTETGGGSYTNVGIINSRNNSGVATQQELYYNAVDIGDTQNEISDFSNVDDSRYWIGRSEGWEASTDARIAEIITYSSRKNDADLTNERNKIQSYLAIKYGITLGVNGTSQDYVDSDGTVIWDQAVNSGFNYDITGIGRDDVSELNQKQSKSVNTEITTFADATTGESRGLLTIGLSDIYNTNNENRTLNSTEFNDKEFLVWGNNNGDLDNAPNVVDVNMSVGISGLDTWVTFTGMERVWKVVENGGDIPKVKLSIPKVAVRNISPPGSYLMFISDTPVFNPTSDYRIMADDGTDLTTEYDFDGEKYITFGYAPKIVKERSIYFDGLVDYVDMEDALDLNSSEFTISAWIKRDTGTTNASIVSKRDATYTEGYDFRINGSGQFEFVLNGGVATLTSSVVIPENEWHQVAIIYNAGSATLYIDGVADTSASSLPNPVPTTQSFYLAAAGKSTPTDFFAGNIDEVRIWNIALSEGQLRYIMNQELIDKSIITGLNPLPLIKGYVIPTTITNNEISAIPWSDLAGYYPLSVYTYTNTNDMSGNGNQGALRNLNTVDFQTAPLPYVSDAGVSTDWDTSTTWVNGDVQTIPGAKSIIAPTIDRDGSGGPLTDDDRFTVDWNIVQISSNVTMNNTALPGGNYGNRNVLGLIIDNTFELTAEGNTASGTGNGLTVTHYLKLDGILDLEGESQLIQTLDSDFDSASTGYLERDQQGEGNLYRYNYWSSPVYTGNDGNNYATVGAALKDGTTPAAPVPASFTGSYDGLEGPPITLSTVWMYKYANKSGAYSEWVHVGSSGTIYSGEGFTMKGTKAPGGTSQNYVFVGKPNNGTITLNVTKDNSYLVGNPYASAIDGYQFINDNASTITGPLYFWEHYGGDSHNLKDYQGGYATLSLGGGLPAASAHADVNQTYPGVAALKTPIQHIPIGQSFYVVGDAIDGGDIEFNNGQRTFMKEGVATSVFMKSSNTKSKTANVENSDIRPKFRIGFDAPKISHRQLLLTIDENASDAVDWGYDAKIFGIIKDDMYWMIDDKKYVIQATNTLTLDKEIPLGIQTEEGGLISIMIDALENAEENTSIYIKDKLSGETYDITNQAFEINLEAGEYLERFVLTFQPRLKTLEEVALVEGVHIFMNNTISELQVNKIVDTEIVNVNLFNYLGQQVNTWNINTDERFVSLPIQIATGVYIVQVNTTAGVITKKVIIE